MRRGTGVLRGDSDRAWFARLQLVASGHREEAGGLDDVALLAYVRESRRRGWAYAIIAEALGVSPARARRVHRAWQDSRA